MRSAAAVSASLGQAAAEYVAVMLSRGLVSVEQLLGGLAATLEEHWLAVGVGALVVFALWRVLVPRR